MTLTLNQSINSSKLFQTGKEEKKDVLVNY